MYFKTNCFHSIHRYHKKYIQKKKCKPLSAVLFSIDKIILIINLKIELNLYFVERVSINYKNRLAVGGTKLGRSMFA